MVGLKQFVAWMYLRMGRDVFGLESRYDSSVE